MFLARTVEHTVDVDGMLSRMEPGKFDEWYAEYTIQKWGVEIQSEEKPKGNSLDAFKGMAGF